MSRIGIVCGIAAEARLLARAANALAAVSAADAAATGNRPTVRCAGADSDRANAAARELIAAGARGLVSFGVAGGLANALRPGTLHLAEAVVAPDGRVYVTDPTWRAAVDAAIDGVPRRAAGIVAGSGTAILTVDGKAALRRRTGADTVDMESHAVAAAAAGAGLPFVIVRAVADPALRAVPPSAIAAIGPEGETSVAAALAALVRRPQDLAALLRLAADSRAAFAGLRRAAALLLPGFGFGR